MKIALLNPLKFQEKLGKKNEIVSLTYLKEFMKKYGYYIDIYDLEIENLLVENEKIKSLAINYDMIGISCYFPFIPIDLAFLLKKYNKKLYIFAGGPMASLTYSEILYKDSPIDSVIVNEGEWSLLELVKRYERNEEIKDICGVASYVNGKVEFRVRKFEKDIDKFPFPIRKRGHYNRYIPTVISSRGCNGKCMFCSTRYTGSWRGRSPENVIEEIKHIVYDHNELHFQFVEPNFLNDGERAIKIANLISKLDEKVTFDFGCRIDSIIKYPEAIKSLKRAGAIKVLLGVESFCDNILEAWKKEITCEEIKQAIQILKDNELAYSISLIMFYPETTIEELINNVKQIESLDSVNYVERLFNTLLLIPGTKLNITSKEVKWDFRDDKVKEIHDKCIEYANILNNKCNDFKYVFEDRELISKRFQEIVVKNSRLKFEQFNYLKKLLGMEVYDYNITYKSKFIKNKRMELVEMEIGAECIVYETGLVYRIDKVALEILNEFSDKSIIEVGKDIQNSYENNEYYLQVILNNICILLRNKIFLIEEEV